MNYKYIKISILVLLISQITTAQQMPIDFSDVSHVFNVWGGSVFSTRPSPTDSNNTIGQFFHASSAAEQGFYIDLTRPINLDSNNTITLAFYAEDPQQHTVGLKLEQGDNANIQIDLNVTSQNNWTTLSYDFSTIGGNGNYSRLTILIDIGSATPGAYFIDDITDGSTPTDPNAIDVIYNDLVWSDEFNIPGDVNSSNWHKQTQVIIPGVGWANNEEQHYTNRLDNSFVDNSGALNIVAKRETFNDQGITKNYTSARLNSDFAFTYGRVDVRAKLPAWDGTWPAIWTLGKNINENGGLWDNRGFGTTPWPTCGEIDIMEHGLGPINHTSSALHTNSSSGATINYRSQEISDVAANWHIYSVNWSPNQITFLVDGVGFYTYNPSVKNINTWPFTEDQYILLNVAMGGISGAIDPNVSSGTMLLDYVRIYQNTSLSSDEIKNDNFRIYPNPTQEEIYIKSNINIDYVELFDVLGNSILKKSKSTNLINVSNLNSGIYFLNIYANSSKLVKKVVIN